jgi:hypothetical protein
MARLGKAIYGAAACCALAACSAMGMAQEQAKGTTAQVDAAPIAIVPIDASATVSGALQVTAGRAIIATAGTVTSGAKTTDVVLPHRGTLRVCATTTVKLATNGSADAGEAPGLMMALDHGAVEASFAEGRSADVLLTPDFRIAVGAAGTAEVKVRLAPHGDTCVDNAKTNAPDVVVTSVWDGGTYTVHAGQRVMFQHGSLDEVVDQEKEPCGCPPEPKPGSNDFPLAQSAGMAPLEPAAPLANGAVGSNSTVSAPLVYQAPVAEPASTAAATSASAAASQAGKPAKPAEQKKPGFFKRVGNFFRRIFGAES